MMVSVFRTEQIWLKPDDLLADLYHRSKNLYNKDNYLVRQAFFQMSQWLHYQAIWMLLKDSSTVETGNLNCFSGI